MSGFSSLGGQIGSNLAPVQFTQGSDYGRARAYVVIDGSIPYAIKSFEINKNCHGATNTASFEVPYATYPDWTNQLFRGEGPDGSSNFSPVYIKIYAGFPSNPGAVPDISELSLRFYGIMDEYDPQDMDKTKFVCRSIASPLTTDRTTTQVQNITTVDFLKSICKPYNIPVFVDPELTQPFTLAKVYAQEFLVGLKNLVKWDIIQRSSIFDDVDVWEDDGTVYYVHPWNVQKLVPKAKTFTLTYGKDVLSFHGQHASQFSRQVRVLVHSYRAKTRVSTSTIIDSLVGGVGVALVTRVVTSEPAWGTNGGSMTVYNSNGTVTQKQWSSSGGGSTGSTEPISESGKEIYNIYLPNLTPDECNRWAMSVWRQVSMHEYVGEISLVVTKELLPNLNVESRPTLTGYGMNSFNTEYWPRTMTETFAGPDDTSGTAGGWTVHYKAVNHTLPLGGGV